MGYREIPVGRETCLGCQLAVEEGTTLCPRCGSPIDISQFAELELTIKPHLRQARGALALATLTSLCFLLFALLMAPGPLVVAALFGVMLFGGCALLSIRRPLAASTTALAAFSLLQIAVIAQGRAWILFQSSIVLTLKVILLVLLAGGVSAGLRARDLRRQTRPRDRKVAAAVVATTLAAGIALGLWMRRQEVQEQVLRQYDDAPDTMNAAQE